MIFERPLLPGVLMARRNRFLADVRLATGEEIVAHCPNSGSMLSCNVPGSRVYVSHQPSPTRKLQYTWELVEVDGGWVGINTLRTNRLAAEALERGLIPAFRRYREYRSEVTIAEGCRIDFVLGRRGQCLVEVKNVSLVHEDAACFPDSITERGAKHLHHLMAHVKRGGAAYMLYVIQHHGGCCFRPADHIDPAYSQLLRKAVRQGVKIEAWRAAVSPDGIELSTRVKVNL